MGQMRLFYTRRSTIPPPPTNLLTCSKMTGQMVALHGPVESSEENIPSLDTSTHQQGAVTINLPQAGVEKLDRPAAAGSPNSIQINLTQQTAVPNKPSSNSEGLESKPFSLTQ